MVLDKYFLDLIAIDGFAEKLLSPRQSYQSYSRGAFRILQDNERLNSLGWAQAKAGKGSSVYEDVEGADTKET